MQDNSIDKAASSAPGPEVSPDNPCPFLRAAVSEGVLGGHVVPLSQVCKTVEAASGKTGLQKKVVGMKTCLVALVANGLSPLQPVAQLVVGTDARRLARWPAGQAWRRFAHSRCHRPCQRGGTGASGRVRQGLRRSARRNRARPDQQRNRQLHEREFRARQGPPALVRPQADEWRMACLARYHGQGRGRAALPQRGRGQDAVRGTAAARPHQRAAGVPDATLAGRHRVRQACQGRSGRRRASGPGAGRDRRISRAGQGGHAVDRRKIAAAGPAGAAPGESGTLARPELVDGGPALVPPCEPGHRDLPGALLLVRRAGTGGDSSRHLARPAFRPALSRALRLHPKPEIRQRRCRHPAPLRLRQHARRQDRARAAIHCRPEADVGG